MRNDIMRDEFGEFFRDNGDGTVTSVSTEDAPAIPFADMHGTPVVWVRNGAPVVSPGPRPADPSPILIRMAVMFSAKFAI